MDTQRRQPVGPGEMRSDPALKRGPCHRHPRPHGTGGAAAALASGERCLQPCRHRLRRQGDAGGAITLFVVLMVPVLLLAAVAASAVPRRLAAESSTREAAQDIADLAYIQGASRDPVAGLTFDGTCDASEPGASPREVEARSAMCATMRGLGAVGVNVESVRGYYTNVLHSGVAGRPGGEASTQQAVAYLCQFDSGSVNAEAVYVSVVADWSEAGWAASQIWPQGQRIGAEALAIHNPTASELSSGAGSCKPARDAVNRGSVNAAVTGDPIVRHPMRAEP